jgi:uncharacterized protein (DUF2126 family)
VDDFLKLIAEIDATRRETGVDVLLEGYPPPPGGDFVRLSVTPDPGVLEVNLMPTAGVRAYATLMGGPTPLSSPFLRRPDLLASLLTFNQHHPSLSYMFAGLFVGPTSQAPRVDEARHENLYELEIALSRAFERRPDEPLWLSDLLFRHMLVDVTGNTHRAEVSIDKLFDPQTVQGRQGLIELRAFEMPPHFRMAVAQMILVRTLLASFAEKPYSGRLVRWGQILHDRFLLPYYLWRDF